MSGAGHEASLVPRMRIPGTTEPKAFKITLGVALLSGFAVIAGAAVTPLYGIAVFGVGALAGAAFEFFAKDPGARLPLRGAARSPHAHAPEAGIRHVLVVANETLAGPTLRDEIVGSAETRLRLDVLAPVLTSRMHFWASDYDDELEEARRRLAGSLAWAASQGLEARGEVGDPDPYTALEDELRDFGADEVIVVTHPRERANRIESGELKRLRAELDVPVTHVVADRERRSIAVEGRG